MKHFFVCLLMLLLLVVGKYNSYQQPPATAALARQAAVRSEASQATSTRPVAGIAPRVAALMIR
ncbi:hypothetical protein [Hymenobacter rigui]|uniref:hypothetical protein n=1 Tax=Hymenobacter rigui TaxID=334424 RepID=UPI0011CF7E47|nr:hypothetical protein [Hymenobacter rigui]